MILMAVVSDDEDSIECHRLLETLRGACFLMNNLNYQKNNLTTIESSSCHAKNIHWQMLEISKSVRAKQKNQTPRCIWFTGLSGSGKSTLANLLEKRLFSENLHTYVLDGDNLRHGLNLNLGFSETDRIENIRRVSEVARLMVDAGLIVLVSFISPFEKDRAMARNLFAPKEFIEVFVDTPFDECARRDVKGLYAKALRGEIKDFTGLDSPYEVPEKPEVHLLAGQDSAEECVEQLLKTLILV